MKTSIATVSLSGGLEAKLGAIAAAGFDGYELFENDLTFSQRRPKEIRQLTADLGLSLFALQPFRDFEGLLDARRSAVFDRAERKFDLMEQLGTDLLLIPSSVSLDAVDSFDRYAEDLRELGDRANARGLRVGYEALAWGRHVRDWTQAWDIVRRADHDQVGLVLDTYHLFVRGNSVAPIRTVPAHKIVMVQLADAPSLDMEVLRHSRHLRNFPGQGDYPIVDFLHELIGTGYDGVISHEIFNDDFRVAHPEQTATDGYRSMMWLQEEVQRTGAVRYATSGVPTWVPPTKVAGSGRNDAAIDGVAFVEFAVTDDDEARELHDFLARIGFTHSHRHKTKAVDLFSCGGTYLAINAEPGSYSEGFADRHGAAACAVGVTTEFPRLAYERAVAYLAEDATSPTGDGEADLPAVRGVGDVLTYFVASDGPHFVETDFDPVDDAGACTDRGAAAAARLAVDHVGIAVAPHELLSAVLFFRAVLGFDLHPVREVADPHGLVTSRAVQSQNSQVRFALSASTGAHTSPERFRSASQGTGVQHIAIATSSIVETVAVIDSELVLSIPENYYVDLEARFGLDPATMAFLRAHNVLFDQDADGTFFHFYTCEIHGVFIEFVERDGYHGFGAANAPVRLAAQSRQRV